MEFERGIVGDLVTGLREMPQFLQIVIGPRQVGKTTAVRQAAERLGWPSVVASADEPLPPGAEWVEKIPSTHLFDNSTEKWQSYYHANHT